jgi:hypothetical protein
MRNAIPVMSLGDAEKLAYDTCAIWSARFAEFPGCDKLGLNPDVPTDKNVAAAIVFAIQRREPELAIMFMYGIVTGLQMASEIIGSRGL